MQRVIVDSNGAVTIAPELVKRLGLRPGDEMNVIETSLGWSLFSDEVDATTLEWWESLTEDERKQAAVEAREYESLSEKEKDAIWNQFDESLDEDDERIHAEPNHFSASQKRAA